jgi:hypothetical protein
LYLPKPAATLVRESTTAGRANASCIRSWPGLRDAPPPDFLEDFGTIEQIMSPSKHNLAVFRTRPDQRPGGRAYGLIGIKEPPAQSSYKVQV